jgi:hypothetical protein
MLRSVVPAAISATKEPRKNNFALSGGTDVAQALVPAGSRLFSTPCPQARSAEMSLGAADRSVCATSVAVKLFLRAS